MTLTIEQTAIRIQNGTAAVVAIKEHIDAWKKVRSASLYRDEPPLTGRPELDAYLAGAAHHEAALIGDACPAWANHPSRFLPEPYIPGGKNSRHFALIDTPQAFRVRNFFCGTTTIS